MATTAAPKSTTTKPRTRKPKPVAETEPIVFDGLPKREYTLKRPPAHEAFVAKVVEANRKAGVTAATPIEERKFLPFPLNSKGVASAINKGVYVAMPKGEFIAKNRTIKGVQYVLVTVAFPEDA